MAASYLKQKSDEIGNHAQERRDAALGNEGNVIRVTSEPFGIYIQTYPGDFDLASVLIASIQQVSLEIPIMLIPGDDFD